MPDFPGVLILAAQRDVRRDMFDAFDHVGFRPILAARDVAQAESLLLDEPPLALVVLALEADPGRVLGFAHALRSRPAYRDTPMIAVVDDTAAMDTRLLAPVFNDWLRRASIRSELLPRATRSIGDATTTAAATPDVATQESPAPAAQAPAAAPVLARHDLASRALSMVSALAGCSSDDAGLADAVATVANTLEFDVVSLWAFQPEHDESVELARFCAPNLPVEGPSAAQQGLLKVALRGDAVVALESVRGLGSDSLVQALGLGAYAALPLMDERRVVLGALVVGRMEPVADAATMEAALRTGANRFASALELRAAREQGRARGLLDAVTGLPNRLLFNDRLDTNIREAHRTGECFAVMFVDLDRFKSINDSLGHATGDLVLAAVARRLQSNVRASDTVARYAGDEFTVILRHIIKRDDVLRIAEKIVQVMESPLMLGDGSELQITASIGVSFFPDDASDSEMLLRHADEAMYGAKSLGRNNFQVYASNPDTMQQQHVALKSKLRHAERNNELRVYYQPQVRADSEDIVGMEALVRWEHPELGTISPAFFIPLAEASGLIVSIGAWVLRTACIHARAWQEAHGFNLRLGVNLSAVQLMQPNLVDTVADILNETGFDPQHLELEVTESISVKTVPNLVESLDALHALGCRIAIDDFGTGAASLDYLRRLPADRIKIDQSFVRNIGVDPDDEAIVRATIDMAHRLKRGVVAEGVEIEQHLDFLRANGCDELQGYLFCRPLPHLAFEKLLNERARILAGGLAPVDHA
jgi:diguanylate cyclase (GGDEF)-like protein